MVLFNNFTKNKMISVIIPTYKGSDKILLPIYSVIKQDYKNIEIIVVDDNGLGTIEQIKTEQVLKSLIEKKIIKYIPHEQNRNGSAARNTGFLFSKGKYINFLDDDDFMLPSKLMMQKNILDKSSESVAAVICGTYFVHKNGKGYSTIPNSEVKHLQKNYLCEKVKFNTSAVLFKREAVIECNGFDESFKRHQDWEFCIRLMSKYSFVNCKHILLIKYATGQNTAGNPEISESYYNHFSKKMNSFFSKLSKEEQLAIQKYHYKRLYKFYLMSNGISKAIAYAKKSNMLKIEQVQAILELVLHFIKRYTVGNRQLVRPYDEILLEATKFLKKK